MKKIMFNDKYGLTKAVLEGRKTMTRRIIPCKVCQDMLAGTAYHGVNVSHDGTAMKHAKYKPGEVVAVAQPYKDVRKGGYPVDSRYDAFREADWGIGVNGALKGSSGETNKMFVKADLMPHQIRITNVRVERLQDISGEDCFKEGIYETEHRSYGYPPSERQRTFKTKVYERFNAFSSPRNAFAALIDKVSGRGTWDSNPWVFVYEFELVK